MADNLLFEQSSEVQGTPEPFISRQVVQVLDQNGGNYNGQIQIDTSSLSNSGKYASYGEAYLTIPIVTRLTLDSTSSGVANDLTYARAAFNGANLAFPFGAGLKCGSHQLIHSLSVAYNNSDVVQLTPFNNFYVQYKLMTSMSWDDVRKVGPSIGFYPDTADTFGYTDGSTTSSLNGAGTRNNRNFPAASGANSITALTNFDSFLTSKSNSGFLERQKAGAATFGSGEIAKYINGSDAKLAGKDLYQADANNSKVWFVLAKIRLKDLHSFFEQLPLVKGAFLSMRLNTNTASHNIQLVKGADVTGTTAANITYNCSSSSIYGGTAPYMLASGDVSQGLDPLTQVAKIAVNTGVGFPANQTSNFTFKTSVGSDPALADGSHPAWGAQCRLFVPMYTMSPIKEEQYLTLNRTKRVVYQDIYSYQTDVTSGQPFNQLLTNGIPNPTTVVCIPILASSSNNIGTGTGNSKNAVPAHQSPFSPQPGTTSPFALIKDFNIQVAGVNMFTQNEQYDFEQFINELSSQNAINGNLVNGLTSGLISEYDFQNGYRYYVCDVSRRLPSEDSVPKSISIQGKNSTNLNLSIFTFIVFERSITIDTATGQKLA